MQRARKLMQILPCVRRVTRLPLLLLALASVTATGAVSAQAADTAGVVRVAETLLRAISTKDTALARTTMLKGAVLFAAMDPAPPLAEPEGESDEAFYKMLASFPGTFLERMWSPQVRFVGSAMAIVSAPYDFHINGKFSHCGTDVFTLLRSPGGWRISSTTYTVQMKGCATSPLGPPKQ